MASGLQSSSIGSVDGGCFGWKVCLSQTTKTSERHCGAQAARALGLAQLGELSSGCQVLEGAAVGSGDEKTWKAFSDETKRPKRQRCLLEDEVLTMVPPDPLVLDIELMMKTLRSAKKGSAGGPPDDGGALEAALGKWGLPEEVLPAVRLGRMTALQKPDGGVRGVMVGDVFRRLVGRTLAKQFAEQGQAATHPWHGMCCTRCGGVCQSRSKCHHLSIDGVGACDSISRRANHLAKREPRTHTLHLLTMHTGKEWLQP